MTDRRLRLAALATGVAGTILTLAGGQWVERRFARDAAVRTALTTAAYLELVVPAPAPPPPPPTPRRPRSARGRRPPPTPPPIPAPPRDTTVYDGAQLLAQARALTTLPGWTAPVEVYLGTAPLVDATARPLPAAELARLRRDEGPPWRNRVALVALEDRVGQSVVGAVAVGTAPGLGLVRDLLLGFALPAALLVILAAGGVAFERARPRILIAAALFFGLATYADVRGAARRGTDEWLNNTRLLLREAATRLPTPRVRVGVAHLSSLVQGRGELAAGDSGSVVPRRIRVGGVRMAAAAVRLGSGRWIEVRTAPAESGTGAWLLAFVALALVGPLGVLGLAWARGMASRPRELRETLAAWTFVAPAGLHLAAFTLGPFVYLLYLTFHRPLPGAATMGAVLRDPLVWVSLRNTLVYTLYVPVSMAIALLLALALNGEGRGVRIWRSAFLLPYATSVVAVALLWQWLYHTEFGGLNYLLSLVGAGPVDWLGRPQTALLAVMLVSLWVQVGPQMVVFLAGLQDIPRACLDAARVDGASAWQRFWRVTFPLLKPVTLFVFVTGVIGACQVFTYIYVLTSGGPFHTTDSLVYLVYQRGWVSGQIGSAAVLSLLVFVVLIGVTRAQLRLLGGRVQHA